MRDREWIVPARFVVKAFAVVKADTAEKARERFEKGEWVDNGVEQGDYIDWDVTGTITENR